jgi:hypothetical protein
MMIQIKVLFLKTQNLSNNKCNQTTFTKGVLCSIVAEVDQEEVKIEKKIVFNILHNNNFIKTQIEKINKKEEEVGLKERKILKSLTINNYQIS